MIDGTVLQVSADATDKGNLLTRMMKRYPLAKIIIFSMHETTSYATQALKSGVKGYVTKNGPAEDLSKANAHGTWPLPLMAKNSMLQMGAVIAYQSLILSITNTSKRLLWVNSLGGL